MIGSLKQFILEKEKIITLAALFIILTSASFAIGYYVGHNKENVPLVIEKCSLQNNVSNVAN